MNTVVSSPVEHIRIVMQVQTNKAGSKGEFTGSYDALTKIYSRHGLLGVYRGWLITILRDCISYAAWFGCYESLKEASCSKDAPPSILWLMLLGAVAGEAFWLSTYPIDVCKTKLQADSFAEPKFRGIVDVFRKTYRAEGVVGFWRGIVP
mmetsp:Transcript_41483/g.47849  ORF Transcript_41483/g.47849 Transcript_41483/m.47849 type:complete len:150 (-) Transcript_41483:106-555(-)